MKLKKLTFWILVLTAISMTLSFAALAEAPGEGEVILFEPGEGVSDVLPEESESAPFIPESMEKTIFGKDDRVLVNNPSAYPYSAIARLVVTGECGDTWNGTGFMVNKDRMLTASHCLVCTKHGKWAKAITFYFGYKSDKNYLYCYNGRWTAWAGNLFSDKTYSIAGDYGCIRFAKNVGDVTGWLGSRWNLPDSTLSSTYCYYAGYRDGVLRYDSGLPWTLDSEHIGFLMDTQPGNSGGPVFDSSYYAVGIIIAENDSYNVGYRMTNAVKERLDKLTFQN